MPVNATTSFRPLWGIEPGRGPVLGARPKLQVFTIVGIFSIRGPCSTGARKVYDCMRISGNKHMDAISVLSALAEPTRLEALRLLWDGREHCVCELMRELGASQSRMSRHMAALKIAGLVADRRDAQWVRYRRAPGLPDGVVALVDAALALPVDQERRAA